MFGFADQHTGSVMIGVLGGFNNNGFSKDSTTNLPALTVNCNPGYFSDIFVEMPCKACAKGTYTALSTSLSNTSNHNTSYCTDCPVGLTTSVEYGAFGVTFLDVCDTCVQGFCANGGHCDVSSVKNNQVTCSCTDGWSGARCEKQSHLLIILSSVLIVLLISFLLYRHWRRTKKMFHVFISYRVATDAALARRVCRSLCQHMIEPNMNIKCYLDQKDIEAGQNWEASFMSGLNTSCLYLPLISDAGIKPIEDVSTFNDAADNFLLEIESALQMFDKDKIGILPLFVGTDAEDDTIVNFKNADNSTQFPKYIPFDGFDVSRFPNGFSLSLSFCLSVCVSVSVSLCRCLSGPLSVSLFTNTLIHTSSSGVQHHRTVCMYALSSLFHFQGRVKPVQRVR